jgi:hypothetical protein
MLVAADEKRGFALLGEGEEFVVRRILGDHLRDFSDSRRHGTGEKLLLENGFDLLAGQLEFGIRKDSGVFFQDLGGEKNGEAPALPQVDKAARRSAKKDGRYKDIGIENDF